MPKSAALLPTPGDPFQVLYWLRNYERIWRGEAWSAHTTDLGALLITFVVCTALSARVFRWE